MTNEELEKELEITQKALSELIDFCGRMRDILVAHGPLTELDNKYIIGELSVDEYVKQYKEQNSLAYAFHNLFYPNSSNDSSSTAETDSKETDQDGKSD